MKMGSGQFLRDFRRDYNIKKTMAHRKAVLQRKKKADEKKMKVHLQQIWDHRSPCKRTSHARLISLVTKLTHKGLYTLYNKGELQQLCSAYNVRYLARWNKEKLSSELAGAISHSETMVCHEIMSNNAVDIVNERVEQPNRVPVLRIRRIYNC